MNSRKSLRRRDSGCPEPPPQDPDGKRPGSQKTGVRSFPLPPLADQKNRSPDNRLSADPISRYEFTAKLQVRAGVVLAG
jgi:hypothetical protein